MILRNLARSLREQNWTAITVEFVLLVAGVFLGIQAANWNAARIERSLETKYLTRLAEDVRGDLVEIDEIARVSGQRMAALDHLLRNATGKALPTGFDSARGRIGILEFPAYDPDDTKTIGIALFILTTLDGNRLAYDTLVNNDGIGVIRDDSLVRSIQSYYAAVDKVLIFERALEISRVKLVDAEQQAGLSPVDSLPTAELSLRFGADPALLAAAKNYWLYTNRHRVLMNDLRSKADALASRIEREALP
jgi:hypothetical protein